VTAHKVSESARTQIEAAGGSVTLIALPARPKTKRNRAKGGEAVPAGQVGTGDQAGPAAGDAGGARK